MVPWPNDWQFSCVALQARVWSLLHTVSPGLVKDDRNDNHSILLCSYLPKFRDVLPEKSSLYKANCPEKLRFLFVNSWSIPNKLRSASKIFTKINQELNFTTGTWIVYADISNDYASAGYAAICRNRRAVCITTLSLLVTPQNTCVHVGFRQLTNGL